MTEKFFTGVCVGGPRDGQTLSFDWPVYMVMMDGDSEYVPDCDDINRQPNGFFEYRHSGDVWQPVAVPDDIMQTARETAESIFQSEAPPIETIARAIHAERERCVAIVQKTIKKGMEVALAELSEPSDETVEIVMSCMMDVGDVSESGAINYRDLARAAIKAVRSAL